MIKQDCFAYIEVDRKPTCNALKEMSCKDCPFYKKKEEVKNNIFYKQSFKSESEFRKALEKYNLIYGTGHLNDFEEE